MQLKPVATFDSLDPEVFKKEYYNPGVPVVIKNLAKEWPAYSKWSWDYFKPVSYTHLTLPTSELV